MLGETSVSPGQYQVVGEAPVLHHDPFGVPGGAGRIDHIGEIAEIWLFAAITARIVIEIFLIQVYHHAAEVR